MDGHAGDARCGIDTDRDEQGRLLPLGGPSTSFIRAGQATLTRGHGTPPQPRFGVNREAMTAAVRTMNDLTQRKRKQTILDVFPPPAFVYQRTSHPNFNIFQGILLYPELVFHLASHLTSRDLVYLYSISRDFHTIVDTRFTTVCIDQAKSKATESASVFHFRSFKNLCRRDPSTQVPHPDPSRASMNEPRVIPSFRWVQFVLYREKVIHEVFALFAERGVPLPARCSLALKKIWFLQDIPTNHVRIGVVHNNRIITDMDLYFAMCFYVKLDMVCQDPLAAEKRDGLRKLMTNMPDGFTTVLKVLRGDKWRTKQDFLAAWVRHTMYVREIEETEDEDDLAGVFGKDTMLGVPLREVGLLQYEWYGRKGRFQQPPRRELDGRRRKWQVLLRPDQLIMREAVRRGFRFNRHLLRCLLAGYVRPDTLESYEPRDHPHRIPEWHEDEYSINDLVGGAKALSVAEGGDPILDLGNTSKGSRHTKRPEQVMKQEARIRAEQDKWVDKFGAMLAEEVEDMAHDDRLMQYDTTEIAPVCDEVFRSLSMP